MFSSIEPTDFDLCFPLGRFPIRVHPSFWIVSAMLGWNPNHPELTLLWVVCVFVSVLIHELGHALMTQQFGWGSKIVLYAGGGLAISDRYIGDTPGKSLLISLAGPAAGFLFFGLLWLLNQNLEYPDGPLGIYLAVAYHYLFWINLVWGFVNLMPVLPLDGGQAFQALCHGLRIPSANQIVQTVSILTGGALAAFFFVKELHFMALMFLLLTIENLMGRHNRRW